MNYSLSVSSSDNIDCKNMAKYLSKLGIVTSITSNISTTPNIEYGCRLSNYINSKKDLEFLWNNLKNRYNFKCGYLELGDIYKGCILDYLRPSICPQ
tara:strand:+ start:315 stop:605 length:291 start_codon:yes stop_codon:yes gene_type:complete